MKPAPLKPGDTLSLISPASPVSPENTARGIEWLRRQGFRVKTYASTFAAHGYLAGTDEQRLEDLYDAFEDPETDAVFCMRGGYGCSRMLKKIDFDRLVRANKLFSGFSDVTVIHAGLNRRGMPSLHAPMVVTLGSDKQDWVYQSLASALKGQNPIPDSAPSGTCLNPGKAEGILVGGCMILLCDLIGTAEQVNFRDRIVLLEDVDEAPHRVDAMLTHLLNVGAFEGCRGIVIGEMTRTDEKPDKMIGALPWREIVAERLGHLPVPIILDFPCGHAPNQLSLPLGVRVELDADSGRLIYGEWACRD